MKGVPTEAQEQRMLFEWAEIAQAKYPELRSCYHVPNGGTRNPIEARHLKEQGVRSGVPDVCLPVARGGYHGLYIEMKRVKGGRISDQQREWISMLNAEGYKAVVCRGFEEARTEIINYLDSKGE